MEVVGVIIGLVFIIVLCVLSIAMTIAQLIGQWKLFEKAGVAPWKSLIPMINFYEIIHITGIDERWMLSYFALCIPFVNFLYMFAFPVLLVILYYRWLGCYGVSSGMRIAACFLFPLPFILLIAGTKPQYQYDGRADVRY